MGSQLKLKFTEDRDLIFKIMTDKTLFNASMPDEDIKLLEEGSWKPATDCQHLVCGLEGKSIPHTKGVPSEFREPKHIAIIRLYSISNITVDVHFHLLPEYWGTGISAELQSKVENFLKDNTTYCKIIIQTPQCCREVLKAATREGFELEGILTSGILWRNKIENIILMAKSIDRRGKNNG